MAAHGHGWQGARRALGMLAAVAIVAGAIVGTAGSAEAASGGAITGRVLDAEGQPIKDLCVGIENQQTVTDEEGHYALEGVEPGSYTVQFNCWSMVDSVREWYDDVLSEEDATPVQVVDGETTANIDAQLEPAAKLSGTVTDEEGGPVGGICVNAYGPDRTWLSGTTTAPDGSYTVGSLPASEARFHFFDCGGSVGYVEQWWDHQPTFDDATPIDLSTGEVITGIDVTLVVGGTITGKVTAPGSPEVQCVFAIVGDRSVAYTETHFDGSYTMRGIPPGEVRVLFRDCHSIGPYMDQWWDHVDSQSAATPIAVEADETITDIDADLERASVIAGRVQDVHGDPIRDICVATYGKTRVGGAARTDDDGNYTLPLPSAGAYKVQFLDCDGTASYVGEWWDDQPTAATAAEITVGPGATVGGIDAVLAEGAPGSISGRVTNLGGAAMTTACVIAYVPQVGAAISGVAGDGTYSLIGLGPGEYYVAFFDCDEGGPVTDPSTGAATYNSVWAPNEPVIFEGGDDGPDPIKAGAELVAVTAGGSTTLDHCFGCDGITITAVDADTTEVTVGFSTPALFTAVGDPAVADDAGFAAVADSLVAAAPPDPARDAAFTYTATCTSNDGGATGSASGTAKTLTVSGLTAGQAYSCVVTAADGSTTVAESAASQVTTEGGTNGGTPAAGNQAGAAPAATSGTSDLATTGASGTEALVRMAVAAILVGLGLIAGTRARKRFLEA